MTGLESGDPGLRAAVHVAWRLAKQGDVASARAAYQLAIDSAGAEAASWEAHRLGVQLAGQDDSRGATAAYQLPFGFADLEPAVWAASQDPRAGVHLAWRLVLQGDVAGARAAYQLAIDRPNDEANHEIPFWEVYFLAELLSGQGDVAGARVAYQLVIDFDYPEQAGWAAYLLGKLLSGQGDVAGACAAYQLAIDYGRDAWYVLGAALRLGELLHGHGDIDGAIAAYQRAIAFDPTGSMGGRAEAAVKLGPLLAERGDLAGAKLLNETADHAIAGPASQGPGGSGSSVILSNRDRIDRGLGFLASGLQPFVHAQMTAYAGGPAWAEALAAQDRTRYGSERWYSLSDPRFLLRVITEQWGAFRDRLSQVERGFASELRDTGNRWAHNEAFSAEDTYRALDTIERLLTAIGAAEQASHVRRIRTDLHSPRSDG